MNILIADDERPARSELEFLLSSVMDDDTVFMQADSANAAMELLRENRFGICFLDIEMGDVKGTTLAAVIREKQPEAAVIFVTAYEHYAAEAFDLDAVDYVMKPYDLTRIKKTLERLKNRHFLDRQRDEKDASQNTLKSAPLPDERKQIPAASDGKVALNAGSTISLVKMDDIVYVEAIRHGTRVHTVSQSFDETAPLQTWERKLSGCRIFRAHKSYLVNLRFASELVPDYNNGYAIRLSDEAKTLIPISRGKIREVRELFSV